MRLEKYNTVYCDRFKYTKLNDLLGEIFRKLINFNTFYGYWPKNLLIKYSDLERIKKEKSNIISTKNGQDYILGMAVTWI
ncbi:MAG: hypothetical protein IJV15_00105 [Lachnospiraceae bacterium]|nr:hypothetical protein [Lachnospiraceae bacterium]